MDRRFLFKALGTAGLGGLFGYGISKALESPYGLGEYKSHSLTFSNIRSANIPNYAGYIEFPIEDILTIEYANGSEQYHSFNMPANLVAKINKMSGKELFRYRVRELGNMTDQDMMNQKWTEDFIIDDKKIYLNSITCSK